MYKDFKNYYSILEVGFGASEAEIKAAYRSMARNYHPDRHPEETERYTALFQEIMEAYDTLSDPMKKMDYDFRYRQIVLGEGPQYEYYTDDTPEDTTNYKHTYTRKVEGNFSFIRIFILALLAIQLYRAVSQTADVAPDTRYSPLSAPSAAMPLSGDAQNFMQHSNAADSALPERDSVLYPGVSLD